MSSARLRPLVSRQTRRFTTTQNIAPVQEEKKPSILDLDVATKHCTEQVK
jgi:hypothetical protein